MKAPLIQWRKGKIPLIELAAYYQWLPEESATKAAQAGDKAARRWSEQDWMVALQVTYTRLMLQVLWIGLRLKGSPPKTAPVKTPEYHRPQKAKADQKKQAEHLARVRSLRRFAPPPPSPTPPPTDDPPPDQAPGQPAAA